MNVSYKIKKIRSTLSHLSCCQFFGFSTAAYDAVDCSSSISFATQQPSFFPLNVYSEGPSVLHRSTSFKLLQGPLLMNNEFFNTENEKKRGRCRNSHFTRWSLEHGLLRPNYLVVSLLLKPYSVVNVIFLLENKYNYMLYYVILIPTTDYGGI